MTVGPKLVLGTVQLGQPYGRANRTGQPSLDQAKRILSRALEAGVAAIDTARAYGEAEARIGWAIGREAGVEIVTKLSPLTELAPDTPEAAVAAAVERSVDQSCEALCIRTVSTVLVHRAAHLTSHGGAIWSRLRALQAEGRIGTLGVSVQTPDDAFLALRTEGVGHVQLPFNILDWRWRDSGVIAALTSRSEVTVHARSVFLQGVLASRDPGVWPRVPGIGPSGMIAALERMAHDFKRESVADLCLAYVRAQEWIDGVVVGVETEEQLETNVALFARPPLSAAERNVAERRVPRVPQLLLNPAQWPQG